MSNIAMQGGATGTGTVTLLAPSTSTDRTLTLPDVTATLLSTATPGVPVNGPAFFARRSSGQIISFATATKVQIDAESFDTNSCFDSTTNYRFTPTVAGYYQIAFAIRGTGSTTHTSTTASLYKNGSALINAISTSSAIAQFATGGGLVYLNGSTDYIELYATIAGTGTASIGHTNADGSFQTWMSGALVRAA